MKYYQLRQEVRILLENIENLQANDFMQKKLYEDLFAITSKIDRSEVKFKLMDRAKNVRVKSIAEEFIKEFQKAEQEKEKEEKIELDSNVNETPLPTVDTDEDSMDDEDIQD